MKQIAYSLKDLLEDSLLALLIGAAAALSSSAFLLSLKRVLELKEQEPFFILLLPLFALASAWLYQRFGRDALSKGHNLLLEELHEPKSTVPLRLVPLVFAGSLLSHLGGASVGREGVGVQMGGALADQISPVLKLSPSRRRLVIMAGVSGGFASIFGTPLAGTLFGLEVLYIGKLEYRALPLCLLSALVSDWLTRQLGISHDLSHLPVPEAKEAFLFLPCLLVGIFSGLFARLFSAGTAKVMGFLQKIYPNPYLRALFAAMVFTGISFLSQHRYDNLGVNLIQEAFAGQTLPYDFLLKLCLTALCVGAGFKGGEVTPLFSIGASLGAAMGLFLPGGELLPAVGLAALFAGAANTPLCCIFLASELFGGWIAPYAALACVASYLFSGHSGIYSSQRIGAGKSRLFSHEEGKTLGQLSGDSH